MICHVVFSVGSELSIFGMYFPQGKTKNKFLDLALFKLLDMYSCQFSYMSQNIDKISKSINNESVTIIGYFDDKFNFTPCGNFYTFNFNDLDVFKELKLKLDDKFHTGGLKRSNVKYAKKGDNVVKLESDEDVKDYVNEMKGEDNEIQKD